MAGIKEALLAAKRELREETGYESEHWEHMLTVPSAASIADNYAYIFRAKECRRTSGQRLDDTEFMNVELASKDEISRKIFDGEFESQDLLAIIDDAYSRFGNDIELGLQGESMECSISLCTLQYKPNVKFVVADCGFTNLYELIGAGYKTAGMGAWTPLINTALILADGFDMKKTSAIDAIKDNTIPICFIHGEDDAFIVPENSRKLSEATKGYQELHLIPKAGHAESREVAGEGSYSDIIQSFIKNAVD